MRATATACCCLSGLRAADSCRYLVCPDQIEKPPGCFRCHDGKHVTADGKRTLNHKDCNTCQVMIAEGRGGEINQLHAAGSQFKHPEEGSTRLSRDPAFLA